MATATTTPEAPVADNATDQAAAVTPQEKFANFRAVLNAGLIERQEEVDIVLTAALMREHPLLVGVPGCQPAGSKVLMEDGTFKNIEDVKVGDGVLSPQHDGSVVVATVTDTAINRAQPIYRVRTKGRSQRSYLCSDNHLVPIAQPKSESTASARERGVGRSGRRKSYEFRNERADFLASGRLVKSKVFTTPAFDLDDRDYLVHPYVVGVLLGDGCLTGTANNPSIVSADYEIIDRVKAHCCLGAEIRGSGDASTWNVVGDSVSGVESLEVWGCRSHDKFVPLAYMSGSLDQRLELLAGMIDTDGTWEAYSTASRRLADDFAHLIHSIGGTANVTPAKCVRDGRVFHSFKVHYSTAEHEIPVSLDRKRRKPRGMGWKNPRNRSYEVERVGVADVYGISLDSESLWYITDDYLVTHNTAKSMLCDAITAWVDGPDFSILLNKFSTPEEVYGPVSLAGLKSDDYRRITDGFLPTAQVAFLDEIFKASSAILNTMLKVLNERRFRNGRTEDACPLEIAVAASNEWPQEQNELGALFDRFLFRRKVETVRSSKGLDRLLWDADLGPKVTETITVDEINQARAEAMALVFTPEAKEAFMTIVAEIRAEGIFPGDRRLRKAVNACKAYAYLDAGVAVAKQHLGILAHVLWEDPSEQPRKVGEIVGKIANPAGMKVRELMAQVDAAVRDVSETDISQLTVAIQKLKAIKEEFDKLEPSGTVGHGMAHCEEEAKRLKLAVAKSLE